MPRKLKRYTGRGDLHFITFSCFERRPFLQSKRVRNLFVKTLGEVRARLGFQLIGYVVMPEHVDGWPGLGFEVDGIAQEGYH